jgi:macrodomain Ter protein organizer (MatP/YcbG family)
MTTASAPAGHDLEYTVVLLRDGEARQKQVDREGQFVPVLVLEAESNTPLHMPVHIEQHFPAGHMAQAEAAARHYRKGQRLTVQTPVLSQRLAMVATHIHTHKNETEPV